MKRTKWLLIYIIIQSNSVFGMSFDLTLASLTNHNTSAYAAYNQAKFPANFGTTSWVNRDGTTIAINPTEMDMSLNPVTPGHVSKMDVHTLIPSRPDLRWFAHITPWFTGSSPHINIGLTNNTTDYVQAMVTDMKYRGFNGVIIDWDGPTDSTDGVTQKIKSYLASLTNNTFTYIVMIDKGTLTGTNAAQNQAILQTNVQYCQTQYLNDTNYEREPLTNGKPILMFFGARAIVGDAGMAAVKANTGGNMIWVENPTYLYSSWEDQCFLWTDQFDNGINTNDPFNLTVITNDYVPIRTSGKMAFGAMCGNFNGTLTGTTNWSLGRYLPSSNGLCLIQRAAAINSVIPANVTRMQWATWSDWEEGTEVESPIDNNVTLSIQIIATNILSWTNINGDQRTIDHYEIYASTDGTNAAYLGSVPVGVSQTNLSTTGFTQGVYQLYVDAIGKPCIHDHISPSVSYSVLVQAPVTTTLAATSIGITNATLNATVNPGGASTAIYFQYGLDTNYGSLTATNYLAAGLSLVGISNVITKLLSATPYHFRAVAINSAGTNLGSDLQFTTLTNTLVPLLQYTFDDVANLYFAADSGASPQANGYFSGAATRTSYGQTPTGTGFALDLAGSNSGVNNWLTVSNAVKLNNLTNFTLCAWVNLPGTNQPAANDRIFGKEATGSGFGLQFVPNTGNSTLSSSSFRLDLNVNSTSSGIYDAANLNASNQWLFVAVTYNGANLLVGGSITTNVIFYSGTLASQVASIAESGGSNTGYVTNNPNQLRIGGTAASGSDRTPPVWVDDVRIYNTVLGPSDLESVRTAFVNTTPQKANINTPFFTTNGFTLNFLGTLGVWYTVQRAPYITGPWNNLASIMPDTSGSVLWVDTNAPETNAFYRIQSP